MDNKKIKGNKKGKQRKTADRRPKNKDKSGESPILKKRTESRRARSKETRCNMNIKVFMSLMDGHGT